MYNCRPLSQVGAHAKGFNAHSVGICYEGGLDIRGQPADTRTPEQKEAMHRLVAKLKWGFPLCSVLGHKRSPPLARKWWGFLSNTSQGDRHGVMLVEGFSDACGGGSGYHPMGKKLLPEHRFTDIGQRFIALANYLPL